MTRFKYSQIFITFFKLLFLITLFFILFLGHNSWAYQTPNNISDYSLIWEKNFGGNDTDTLNDLILLPDNHLITAGASGSYAREDAWESIWIQKIDNKGNMIKEEIIGDSSYNSGNTIIAAPNKHLIIGGEKNWLYCSSCIEIGESWITMVDYELNINWEKSFNVEGNTLISDMASGKNNGFCLVGLSQFNRSGETKAWLAYANWNGDIVWSKTYDYLFQDRATGVLNLNNNGFLISGYSQTANLSKSVAWILKTDKNGKVEWKKDFETNKGINVLKKIIELDEENFMAIGYTSAKGAGWQDGWVIKISRDGEVLWDKTFGTKNKDIFSSAAKLDKYIIIAGTTYNPDKNANDGWIVKIDENGEVLWEHNIGGENDESFSGINIKNKNILYLFGSSSPAQSDSLNQNGWLVKINLNRQ